MLQGNALVMGKGAAVHRINTKKILNSPQVKMQYVRNIVSSVAKSHPVYAGYIWKTFMANPQGYMSKIDLSKPPAGSMTLKEYDGLGDLTDLFSGALQSLVSAGVQYAGTAATQNLQLQAAQKAADIQAKNLQQQAKTVAAQAQLTKAQTDQAAALKPKTNWTPWLLGGGLVLGVGGLAYVLTKPKKGKR